MLRKFTGNIFVCGYIIDVNSEVLCISRTDVSFQMFCIINKLAFDLSSEIAVLWLQIQLLLAK